MIERLPLDLFDDSHEPTGEEGGTETPLRDDPDQNFDQIIELEPVDDVLLVNCQWCAEQFDNDLPACPKCGAKHISIAPASEEPGIVTCQWCLESFEPGPTNCPSCNARVVVPGQWVPGEDEPYPDYASRGMMARQAHSRQMLVGMIAGGIVDSFAAGLIGLVVTLIDDD